MTRKQDIKLVDAIIKKVGLSKDQRRLLHNALDRQYVEDLSYQEILELAREIKHDYPGKRQR